MNIIPKSIGSDSQLPIEQRIFKIILLFCFFICAWSAGSNYFLELGAMLVWVCLGGCLFYGGLYSFFNYSKQYKLSVVAFFISIFLITAIMWIFNGGTSGTIPLFISLFTPIIAALLKGPWRYAMLVIFIMVVEMLLYIEYQRPELIVGYQSITARFIDIAIAVVTVMVANGMLFIMLFSLYNKEKVKVKNSEESLAYLIHHDPLTGVYNRRYFDSELLSFAQKAVDIGIFVIDIDGLKLVNDLLGHKQGDMLLISAAKVLRESFRATDAVARVGGDEFAVVLSDVSLDDMDTIYHKIRENIDHENTVQSGLVIPLQMSVGYSFSRQAAKSVQQLFRDADSKMYREKLNRYTGDSDTIIQIIKKMLAERGDIGSPSRKMKERLLAMAAAAKIPESKMDEMKLLAEFHYITRVGIPENILDKPGPLTGDERAEMQKHAEVGFRIAQASSELLPIAEWLLKKNEWFNGKGYPLGISGENIPLPCRILAIVDAFDAMTSNRPYRKAMTEDEALYELKQCAGTQFDPALVELFVNLISFSRA